MYLLHGLDSRHALPLDMGLGVQLTQRTLKVSIFGQTFK
jgi:hypothetical protein